MEPKQHREWREDEAQRKLRDYGVKYEDATERRLDHASQRDQLLRETFTLNMEIGFAGYKREYINDSDVIGEWPDIQSREKGLREYWDQQADYAAYHKAHAGESLEVLTFYRDRLLEVQQGGEGAQADYYDRTAARGREDRLDYDRARDQYAERAKHQANDKDLTR